MAYEKLFFQDTIAFEEGGATVCHVIDFDQRRCFAVTYEPPGAHLSASGNEPRTSFTKEELNQISAVSQVKLKRHLHELGHGVFGFHFTHRHGPITKFVEPDEDRTAIIHYPPMGAIGAPFSIKTVRLDTLRELARLGPQLDLVAYPTAHHPSGAPAATAATPPPETRAVFKYCFVPGLTQQSWSEISLMCRLPRDHPHMLPLDALVLEGTRGGVVGFTRPLVPGGTLMGHDATNRPFQLRWLRQLISVVEDLHYRYGIIHGHITPGVLVIHHGNLQMADMQGARMVDVGNLHHVCLGQDDIDGIARTLYEIITRDASIRPRNTVSYHWPGADEILERAWIPHPDVQLDADLQVFRDVLEDWVLDRKSKGNAFTPSSTNIHWSSGFAAPPAQPHDAQNPDSVSRFYMNQHNQAYYNWERPATNVNGSFAV